jgi:serine/threonine-protein kinase
VKESSTPGGERVGRYQLLEPIGTGPCGTVSRAKVFGVAGFERQFAVKRFHPELTITNALAQALSAAARAYGSLEHPRIARMSEFGVAQGQTFTAVEHVSGLDAARLVAETRLAGLSLASGGALALVSQAARAVGYAHGRGLTHLGLAPTNVIINADGDVKITDFGILAAGLPQRPVDVARLQHRIQYLAPEQVANEATSAATDVFALGVIAYELVTGQRTFRGDTPQQIAQSIMAGPPSEPALPRPIVRVLHRCLARSPFERFPDARALADALDAALRVAPVPGTRKDIGAQVKATMDRLAELNDGEMSGMVALHVGTGPIPRQAPPIDVPTLGRDVPDVATNEFVRPDVPVPGPSPLTSPANTMPDLPRPMTTMTGMAPPPIPVPPGIVTVGPPPPPQPRDAPATLIGMKVGAIPTIKPVVPAIPPRPPTPPPRPPSAPPLRADTAEPTRDRGLDTKPLFDDVETPAVLEDTQKGLLPAPAVSRTRSRPSDAPTSEMSPLQADLLKEAAAQPEAQLERVWRETSEFPEVKIENEEAAAVADDPVAPMFEPPRPAPAIPPVMHGRAGSVVEGDAALPSLGAPAKPATEVVTPLPPPPSTLEGKPLPRPRSKLPLILTLVAFGGAGAAVGAWQLMKSDGSTPSTGSGSNPVVTAPADAAQVASATPDAAAADAGTAKTADAGTKPAIDAAVVASPPVDAATPPADAKTAAPPIDAGAATPTGTSDQLAISSTPAGARVYLDGSDTGVTPVKLPGSPDRHTIALLLPGHELYIAQVDGHGTFAIPLKEVTPTAGPAGIKVIKCKDKDRYYVFVDGKPTGMMCPTERIETDVGPHTVEVYDAVTEVKKKWDVMVKDTRLSARVKVE